MRANVDAHKGDGKRYIVQSDELLSAFLELEKTLLLILRAALLLFVGIVSVLAAEPESPIEAYFSPGVSCAVSEIARAADRSRSGLLVHVAADGSRQLEAMGEPAGATSTHSRNKRRVDRYSRRPAQKSAGI